MKRTKRQLLKNEKGQSSVEYLLIVAVLVGVVFMFGNEFTKKIQDLTASMFDTVKGKITKRIGNAPD